MHRILSDEAGMGLNVLVTCEVYGNAELTMNIKYCLQFKTIHLN